MIPKFFKTFALKVTFLIFVCLFVQNINTLAIDIDATVDDNSRSNYSSAQTQNNTNYSVIKNASDVSTKNEEENALPALPKILQKPTATVPVKQYSADKATTKPVYSQPPIKTKVYKPTKIGKLREGMTFNLVASNKITDAQRKGTTVTFTAPKDIKTPYFTIPKGTKFTGKILNSHRPQYTCNGGLLILNIEAIHLANKRQKFNCVITKVGDKKVFFDRYKGKRTYWKTVWQKGAWGRALCNEMWRTSVNLCAKGSTVALSPFTMIYGVLGWSCNTVASPFIAIFNKGGSAVIPAGTSVTVKLLEDVNIQY